ncbi:MAG: selenoprotein [Planctomycetes bacterium]|nr:selenoprotein [Planctomycetota bacterium]
MPQAVGLAAELKEAYPAVEAELVPKGGGVFEVSVNGNLVFSKDQLGRFPTYQEVPLLILGG